MEDSEGQYSSMGDSEGEGGWMYVSKGLRSKKGGSSWYNRGETD